MSIVPANDVLALPPYDRVLHKGSLSPEMYLHILAAGKWFTPPRDPVSFEAPNQCFRLAWELASIDGFSSIAYVEGLAQANPGSKWVHHAWNVTPDGVTVDRTWGRGVRYFGVAAPYLPERHDAYLTATTALAVNLHSGMLVTP